MMQRLYDVGQVNSPWSKYLCFARRQQQQTEPQQQWRCKWTRRDVIFTRASRRSVDGRQERESRGQHDHYDPPTDLSVASQYTLESILLFFLCRGLNDQGRGDACGIQGCSCVLASLNLHSNNAEDCVRSYTVMATVEGFVCRNDGTVCAQYTALTAQYLWSIASNAFTDESGEHTDLPCFKVVESLLNAEGSGRRLISREDDDGRQPIHWASSYNRLPIVEFLAERPGFDINAQDGAGWTALMMAASLKEGDALVDFLLLKGADVDAKTNNGQTALHFASSKSHLDTAKKLIAHKASTRVKDKRGQLPLHRAAAVGHVPIVKLLLENRSPINATDIDGSTALHHAVAEGHGDAAVLLLKHGAETDKKDGSGALAIDLAPDAKIRSYIERAAEAEDISLHI
nr:ankyrin repeat-containing protein c6c3.08 [Quercus suber]